ncbi:MAG: hypothetical protein HQM00_15390 [Magnetococcales bacterium]|nr:hypothetical protein [Magnetococcales bacterium]
MSRIRIGMLIFFFGLGNLLVISREPFIPPSKFYMDDDFSYRLFHYRNRSPIDYLIIGNSRSKPLDPSVLQTILQEDGRQPVIVHSLSVGGGYFPFYQILMEQLIADRPPRTLLLSVSPRDFRKGYQKAYAIRDDLFNSSGYVLERLNYSSFFKWLEAKSTDFLAAAFPLLYYRNRIFSLLFPNSVHKWAQPKLDQEQTFLQKTVWNSIKNLPLPEDVLPMDGNDWIRRFQSYPQRIAALFDWTPTMDNGKMLSENRSKEIRGTLQESTNPLTLREEQWRQYQPTLEMFRQDPACLSEFILEDQREETIQKQFLTDLQHRGIDVYFLIMPAMRLEGCENNIKVNQEWIKQMQFLQNQFPNILGIIDLNKLFRHSFSRIVDYGDQGEHLSVEAGVKVTRQLGEALLFRAGVPEERERSNP